MAAAFDSSGTQLVYGFLSGLIDLNKVYAADTLVIVWDNGHRAKDEMYEHYKEPRGSVLDDDQRADFNKQFDLLNGLLRDLGIKCCFAMDVEADDVIAHLCRDRRAKILNREDLADNTFVVPAPILIVSGDHDLYSLMSDDVSMWKLRKKELYTIDRFREEFSLEPWQYREMLALMGCSSDNVPGVKGIGPKYARKLIAQYGSVDGIKNADDSDTVVARVKKQWDILELSYRLVSFVDVEPVVSVQKPNLSKVRKCLFALGMDSLILDWSEVVRLSEL
jgi:DNA polymerase-1